MSSQYHRLYIFTGKGGVGKTTLAMAYTKYLESLGKVVKYNCFHQIPDRDLFDKLSLPVLDLQVEDSAETYIGKKLNSKTIASWIMKTHFFKSLFQMIPGLGHMILLGNLIDEMEKNKELIIVMDSPASGHALTMFESSSNFKKIFGSGLIVRDIERMQNFINQDHALKTFIITLPTELSETEAIELQSELTTHMSDIKVESEIIVNDSFTKFFQNFNIENNQLPDFLKQKLKLESTIISKYKTISHLDEGLQDQLVLKIKDQLKELS